MLIRTVALALLAVVVLPGVRHRSCVASPRPPLPPHVIRLAGNVHKALHGPPHGLALVPVPVRRIHVYDSKAALNLIASQEMQRRRRAKGRGGPPRAMHRGHGGPPNKRKRKPGQRPGYRPNKSPAHRTQDTRGTSPVSSRVRYRNPNRPPVPVYADGFTDSTEDNDSLQDEERDRDHYRDSEREREQERERPHRNSLGRPTSTRSKTKRPKDYDEPPKRTKHSSKTKQRAESSTSDPKVYGWGDDGGYRVPAPTYPPYTPDDTEEPGTGHLDLEERFINQHSQFYRNGYPLETVTKNSTRSRKKPQYDPYFESDEFASDEFGNSADSSRARPSIVRSKHHKSVYSGEEEEDSSRYSVDYHVPPKSRTRSTRQPDISFRPTIPSHESHRTRGQNKFHAKFRKNEGSSDMSTSYYDTDREENREHLSNHRFEVSHTTPSWQTVVTPGEVKPSTYRTRPTHPQYWG